MALVPCLPAAPQLDARHGPDFDPAAELSAPHGGGADTARLQGTGGATAAQTSVRAHWNDSALFFVFDCADKFIVSPGKEDGPDHYLIGDTVEVFLARRGQPRYAEIHATPAGRKALYFFDGYRSAAPAPCGADRIAVFAAPVDGGWRAVLAVPWDVLGGRDAEAEWEVFLGRYDYVKPGGDPVLSSFPAQRGMKPDFHRRADYATLRLRP